MSGLLTSPGPPSLLTSPGPPSLNASLNASAAKTAYLLAVHEASRDYAIVYVCVVLVCYTVGMTVLLSRHFKRAENQPRLAVLYQAIINRTASLRRRRGDDATAHAASRDNPPAPRAAPQVVVHEPEVSPGPSGVTKEAAASAGRRANGRPPSPLLDEITTDVGGEESSPEPPRTSARVYRETDF